MSTEAGEVQCADSASCISNKSAEHNNRYIEQEIQWNHGLTQPPLHKC